MSVARKTGAAALVLAALALGRVVTEAFPADDRISAPFLRAGGLDETVSLRYADVTVTGVEGSTRISDELGTGMVTPGVYLVVPVTVVTKGEPATLRYAAIVDRKGRTFTAFTSTRSIVRIGNGQPGVPTYGAVAVELPADAVPGARLRLGLDALDQRRDDLADIDLGLTEADARQWAGNEKPIEVAQARDVPPPAAGSGT